MINKINLLQKFKLFEEAWSPKIVGELNGQYIKIARFNGEFVSHAHQDEDELFLVLEGEIYIELENQSLNLKAGEMVVIPKNTMHKPIALHEAKVLMFEPKSTLNTGTAEDARKAESLKWI